MKDQLYDALAKLLRINHIHVNQAELKLQLLSHPSYPSLHSLTGVLNHFNIENLAVRVPANAETLPELPASFIAHLKLEEGEELVLVEQKKANFKITKDKKETELLSQEDFIDAWDGIVVVVEKDETANELEHPQFVRVMNWAFYLSVGLLLGYIVYSNANLFSTAHFGLSLLGLALSIFIVRHELGFQSAATDSICNLSEQTSCDAVLNSKGATLFGVLKLSDLAVITFATFALTWVLYFISGTIAVVPLVMLTLAAIPFVLYSVYYQYVVVKKWCPLCLGIVGVLSLQAGTLSFYDWSAISFSINNLLLLAASGLMISFTWNKYATLLRRKATLEKTELQYYKFKRNFSLFNAVYSEQERIKSSLSMEGEIVLGNANAPLKMVLVSNPLCYFCKQSHQDVAALLEESEDQLKVIIRFNVGAAETESKGYRIATHLLHLYNTRGATACKIALNEVYSEGTDLNQWLDKQVPLSKNYDVILAEQQAWCTDNSINFTPALLLNGKHYPKEYATTDLVHFLDDLVEEQRKSNSQQMADLFSQ